MKLNTLQFARRTKPNHHSQKEDLLQRKMCFPLSPPIAGWHWENTAQEHYHWRNICDIQNWLRYRVLYSYVACADGGNHHVRRLPLLNLHALTRKTPSNPCENWLLQVEALTTMQHACVSIDLSHARDIPISIEDRLAIILAGNALIFIPMLKTHPERMQYTIYDLDACQFRLGPARMWTESSSIDSMASMHRLRKKITPAEAHSLADHVSAIWELATKTRR